MMQPYPSLDECKAAAVEMIKAVPKGPAIGCVVVKEPGIQS